MADQKHFTNARSRFIPREPHTFIPGQHGVSRTYPQTYTQPELPLFEAEYDHGIGPEKGEAVEVLPAPDRFSSDRPVTRRRTVMQSTDDEKRRIAGDYLTRVRDDLERAKRTRIAYIVAARQHGMTNSSIGALLGITEARVRQLAKIGGDR